MSLALSSFESRLNEKILLLREKYVIILIRVHTLPKTSLLPTLDSFGNMNSFNTDLRYIADYHGFGQPGRVNLCKLMVE